MRGSRREIGPIPPRVTEAIEKWDAWIYWRMKPMPEGEVEADRYIEWRVSRDPKPPRGEGWVEFQAPFWVEHPELWEVMSDEEREEITS